MRTTGQQADGAKPRLLVLASTYPRWAGDPEPGFVHELAKRLVGDFEVSVLGPHARGALTNESMEGVRVHRYRYAPAALETLVNDGGMVTNLKRQPWKWLLVPGFFLGMLWALWRLVRTTGPDVIHCHWLLPQGLVVASLGIIGRKVPPFLVTSHGADLFALRMPVFAWLKRFVVRRAAAATVVSDAMQMELARIGADSAKVSTQPMGVDFHERFTLDEGVERSRDELLFVGRLVEKKGLRYLLDAMPAILRERPSAFLTIAGFGPDEAACRERATRLGLHGKVEFLGAVPQAGLSQLYRRAAVFVAPFVEADSGDQEGLGLVMVEAVACGCPVVASDLPAVRQVFDQGDGTPLTPQRDANALAKAVIKMLSTPYVPEVAAARRKRLEQSFGWPQVAKGYAELLVSCVRAVP